jgi:hypothetical protein
MKLIDWLTKEMCPNFNGKMRLADGDPLYICESPMKPAGMPDILSKNNEVCGMDDWDRCPLNPKLVTPCSDKKHAPEALPPH